MRCKSDGISHYPSTVVVGALGRLQGHVRRDWLEFIHFALPYLTSVGKVIAPLLTTLCKLLQLPLAHTGGGMLQTLLGIMPSRDVCAIVVTNCWRLILPIL